ncbi:hypothetical protein RDI58_017951 [Solanum bulbocastanum]|uniref:Uncharacterized protein n=1 Tax=Solanum bulbocastanum TaxID=147425 RepID=A0AAN8YAG6_SOLBU
MIKDSTSIPINYLHMLTSLNPSSKLYL